MKEKLKKLPAKKKEIIKYLQTNYPRVERDYNVEQTEAEEDDTWKLSKTIEEEGFFCAGEFDMGQYLRPFNDHIYYKALKQVYGMPDPAMFEAADYTDYGIKLPKISGTQIPEDWDIRIKVWSYLLKMGAGAYLEVTKGDFYTTFKQWLDPQEIDEPNPNQITENIVSFIFLFLKLLKIVDNDYSIKKERQILTERWPKLNFSFTNNLYSDYLKSADGVIEIAEELSKTKEEAAKGILHFVPGGKLKKIDWNIRTLFISATIYYIMAFEAFINLLYQNLLKPEFEYEQFKRSIRQNCLELSILNLPVYCKGFIKNITPEDDAIRNWTDIRSFRNNLIHANLTEENKMLVAEEDGIDFFYNKYLHHKYEIKNHTSSVFFTKDDAIRVKNTVQKIVADIIDKMDEKTEEWIKLWIDESMVHPYELMWRPQIKL